MDKHIKGAINFATSRLASKFITLNRDLTATSGSVAYTGVGFQPTSVIFFAGVSGGIASWGFVDSTKTGQSVGQDNAGTIYLAAQPVSVQSTPSTTGQTATVSSFDADGFTLSWTKTGSPTGTATVQVLCLR